MKMKKLTMVLILVVVASVMLMAAAPSFTKLVQFRVWNRTDEVVNIQLQYDDADDPADSVFYYLTIPDGTYKTFTVERHVYDATIWSCGDDDTASIDLLTQLQLTFPACTYAPNNGEPSLEKVHLSDTPTVGQLGDFNLLFWRFQY
jgi:hypothetical protein